MKEESLRTQLVQDCRSIDDLKRGFIINNNQVFKPFKIILYFADEHYKVIHYTEKEKAISRYIKIIEMCNDKGIYPVEL